MADPHVITALVKKYSELSGKLTACEKEAETLKSQLSHIDATIRIFKSDYDTTSIVPRRPYRKRNPHFKKGVFIRTAMDILRETNSPITARELAKRTLDRQGISEPDDSTIEGLRRALNGCLMQRIKDGTVTADGSYPKRWEITRTIDIGNNP